MGAYEAVENWPGDVADAGYIYGSQAGVFAETPNRIFLASRGELKLPDKVPNNFNGVWAALASAGQPRRCPNFATASSWSTATGR